MELFDSFVRAGNIIEGDGGGFLRNQFGFGFAKLHHSGTTALHAAEEEPENDADEQEGNDETQERHKPVGLGDLVGKFGHIRVVHGCDDFIAPRRDIIKLNLGALTLETLTQLEVNALFSIDNGGFLHLVILQKLEPLLGGHGPKASRSKERDTQNDHTHPDQNVGKRALKQSFQSWSFRGHCGSRDLSRTGLREATRLARVTHARRNVRPGQRALRSVAIDAGVEDTDAFKVSIPLSKIKPVSHHKLVGNIKAQVVNGHIDRHGVRLAQ